MDSKVPKSKRICISVDGSQYSDYAFDLIFNELYRPKDYILLTHIYNSSKLSSIPFTYQPDTIISKYSTKLLTKIPQDYYSVRKEDRVKKDEHALSYVLEIAKKSNIDILVVGFKGYKPKNDSQLFSSGVGYLIKNNIFPTLVVKQNIKRSEKKNQKFNWLFSIEDTSSLSFKAFKFAIQFFDKKNDVVLGYHIDNKHFKDEIEKEFKTICQKEGIENTQFIVEKKVSGLSIGKQISKFVNETNGTDVDFVIMGNNPGKHPQLQECPLGEVLNNALANVLFLK